MRRELLRKAASDLHDRQRLAGEMGREIESAGQLVLRLRGPALTVEDLQGALSAIQAERLNAPTQVVVDFSEVEELAAPWSLPFAILIHLAREIPVRVRGLHGQPLQVAWLYRGSSEIRKIVELFDGQRRAA